MTDSIPKQIILTVLEHVAAIEGIAFTDYREARDVPGELRNGSCVIGFWVDCPQVNVETGGGGDVTWEWELRVYVNLPDFETAQEDFYALVPAIIGLAQSESLLDDLLALDPAVRAGTLKLGGDGRPPFFEVDEHWAMKGLRLQVEAYQPPIA